MKDHYNIKNILFILITIIVVFFLGKNLLPSNTMFEFHDETQAARVQEFTLNIENGKLPPRIAPNFSFQMGYPVYSFYSPFSYWITSSLDLIGFDVADSLKLSFLIAVAIAFIGMYAFLRLYFKFIPSVAGAVLYVASPWLAAEIFVRGNLGEVWFWALFPLALYSIYEMDEYTSPIVFSATVFILSCILTVHNIFSLLFVPIAVVYIWLLGNKFKNYLGLIFALLLSAYFLFPALVQSSLTYARKVATLTKYSDHFLCLSQLWSAPYWGFAGSAAGCAQDGMAFMVGKPHIILGLLGMIFFGVSYYRQRTHKSNNKLSKKHIVPNEKYIFAGVLILTVVSIFLTTYQSQIVWNIFSEILSLFQFPWRFLFFVVFGLSFFSAYIFNRFNFFGSRFFILLLALYTLFSVSKYFQKETISKAKYNDKYLSEKYIKESVAYKIPEYVIKLADYDAWRTYENAPEKLSTTFIQSLDGRMVAVEQNDLYTKQATTDSKRFLLHIHYFPYWNITVNNKRYTPEEFDPLGRPIITPGDGKKIVTVQYRQSGVQKIGNILSVTAVILLSVMVIKSKKIYGT